MDYLKINNIELENIDIKDYPDFVDAFISYADYDGREMTEKELDLLNEDPEFIHEQVLKFII